MDIRASRTKSLGGNVRATLPLLVAVLMASCGASVEPFSVTHIDRAVSASAYPTAVNPKAVGSYPGSTKSGAGYFYDEVLEYRVWLHPERGAEPLAGDADYFAAFAQFESAEAFARSTPGAESEPLVLVRQLEWINEPQPGRFEVERGERITEWRVEWLDSKRGPTSISDFLANPPTGQ